MEIVSEHVRASVAQNEKPHPIGPKPNSVKCELRIFLQKLSQEVPFSRGLAVKSRTG
jgi:hypothetical protein